jgi:hypothetical protein
VADEASDSLRREVDRLNQRISQLTAENTRRKDAYRETCTALGVGSKADRQSILADLRAAGGYSKVKAELESLRTKSNPTELQQKYDQAVTELRNLKHRDGLKQLYSDKDLGLNPTVSVERLEAILGYKAEEEAFDATKVKQQLVELKTKGSDPYLFGTAAGAQSSTGQSQAAPIWGGGRGASGTAGGVTEFTDAQMRDPVFMHQVYQQGLAAASK